MSVSIPCDAPLFLLDPPTSRCCSASNHENTEISRIGTYIDCPPCAARCITRPQGELGPSRFCRKEFNASNWTSTQPAEMVLPPCWHTVIRYTRCTIYIETAKRLQRQCRDSPPFPVVSKVVSAELQLHEYFEIFSFFFRAVIAVQRLGFSGPVPLHFDILIFQGYAVRWDKRMFMRLVSISQCTWPRASAH